MAFAGLDLIDHIVTLFKEGLPGNPQISRTWEEMEVGFGNDNFEAVYIDYVSENVRPFSLMYMDENGDKWDWFHEPHLSIQVWAGTSELKCRELARAVMGILKRNILIPGGPRGGLYMKIGTIASHHSEYRNMWSLEIPVEAKFYDP